MRDRASVTQAASKILYSQLLDIGCFSHALELVGERMKSPNLDNFTKGWIGLFA